MIWRSRVMMERRRKGRGKRAREGGLISINTTFVGGGGSSSGSSGSSGSGISRQLDDDDFRGRKDGWELTVRCVIKLVNTILPLLLLLLLYYYNATTTTTTTTAVPTATTTTTTYSPA